jgi:hypothetical protein
VASLKALCTTLLITLTSLAVGQAGPAEYQVKAVFLFNFAQFVEWPAQVFGSADTPFTLCVLGEDPFGPELDEAVKGESVKGHPLTVQRHRSVTELGTCQILFIGASERARLDSIIQGIDDHAILTVSDIEGSAERGAIIQFASEHNRLRLRINVQKAQSAGLTLSSKLLRPAEIVAQSG